MSKGDDAMLLGKKICARLMVAQAAILTLEKMAEMEGRDKQRNLGLCLERIAQAFEDRPQILVDLGIITEHVAAAVA